MPHNATSAIPNTDPNNANTAQGQGSPTGLRTEACRGGGQMMEGTSLVSEAVLVGVIMPMPELPGSMPHALG